MSSSKTFQNQSFTPYRPLTTKSIPYSPSAKTQSFNLQNSKTKPSTIQHDLFSSVRQQNYFLREQNKALKKQINMMKGDIVENHSLGNKSVGQHDVNDLRETIKREAGEIKQLKGRLELVSKQNRMYQEIIDKMEQKIHKLTDQNRCLEQQLKQKTNLPYCQRQTIPVISEKVHQILSMYTQLESQVIQQDKEWQSWKERWSKQKSYYLNRIRDLEGLMGIGVQNREMRKKRY